jgi:transcriptional regulator
VSDAPAPFGTLRGHVARANPIWREVVPGSEVLAIFQGPEAYVTPSWYPTKAETGKVVPTWNYAVAHAYGILRVVEDSTWVRTQLEALTAHNEAAFAAPWQVSDAPHEYIDKLLGAVVGIEIVITRLVGKWKTSQNQAESNREGVAHGLRGLGGEEAIAMADLVDAARPSR